MKNLWPILGLILCLGLASCTVLPAPGSQPVSAPAGSSGENSAAAYRFKTVKCPPLELPRDVDCGQLIVPQDHSNPQSGRIRLAVTIIRASRQPAAPDPVLFLSDGPGAGASESLQTWLEQPLLEDRDLILLDLRGVGRSEPNLNCPELEDSSADKLLAARACKERLEQRGIDMALFSSTQSLGDLNALRQALGYESWNLLGVSYGARLALLMMRDYPQNIRSVILDSTYPLQVNAYEERATNGSQALAALFAACQADPECDYAYPDLQPIFDDLLTRLQSEPVQTLVANPFSGERTAIYLDSYTLADMVFESLYRRETLARLPYVIYELHYGKYEAIAGLIFPRATHSYDPTLFQMPHLGRAQSEGAYYSVQCPEEVALNSADIAASAVDDSASLFAEYLLGDVQQLFDICKIWNKSTTPLGSDPVQSAIPSLLLNGQFDPITPAAWGADTAAALPQHYRYTFPGLGHAVLENDACPQAIAARFLDDPLSEPDAACIGRMRLNFWLP